MSVQSVPVTKKQRVYDMLAAKRMSREAIASRLRISTKAATSLVNDLRDAGVYVHSESHLDGRRYWVQPTGEPVSLKKQPGARYKLRQPRKRAVRVAKRPKSALTSVQAKEVIISSLQSLGGGGTTEQVLQLIAQKLQDDFTSYDKATYVNGVARWRAKIYTARRQLVEERVLKRSSPHGYWELTARYRA